MAWRGSAAPQSHDLLPKQPGWSRHHPQHPEEAQQLSPPHTLATKPLSPGDDAQWRFGNMSWEQRCDTQPSWGWRED